MPASPAVLESTGRVLLARTARAQRDGRASTLAAGIARGAGLAWSAGCGALEGPADDVQHRLGSISKTVTALAVMRLRDAGRLRLDDPLERYAPGTPFGDRTLASLLGHLAGATAESPGDWWERTPGTTLAGLGLGEQHRVMPGGRRFHYSNLGFGLLGELLARVHGRPWYDVVRDEVLLPLGMTRTTPRPHGRAAQGWAVHPWADVRLPEPEHDAGVMAAAGQLWATLGDLGRLGALLAGEGEAVVSQDTVEEMCVPGGADGDSAYGLGVQVQRDGDRVLVGHGGSMPGFLAGVLADREERTAAVFVASTTSGLGPGLLTGLLADLREREPRIVEPWQPAVPPVDLDLLGPWYWGPAPLLLRAVGSDLLHLSGLGGAGRTSRFRRDAQGRWRGLDGYYAGEELVLTAEALRLATFVFTRAPYRPDAGVPGGVDERGWRG